MADPDGAQGVRLNPLPSPVFLNILWKWNNLFSMRPNYFILMEYFREKKRFNQQSEVRKTAKIRNQYNQVPHLTQKTTWESNKKTINITNKSQEGRSLKGSNERTRKHEKKHQKSWIRPWRLLLYMRAQLSSGIWGILSFRLIISIYPFVLALPGLRIIQAR